MSLRSKLLNLFVKPKKAPTNTEYIVSGGRSPFDVGGKDANSTYQSCVNCLSNYASMIKPQAFIGENKNPQNRWMDRIISLRPNQAQSASDFYYSLASDYYSYGIALAYINLDRQGYLESLVPINQNYMTISRSKDGFIWLECQGSGGEKVSGTLQDFIVLIRQSNTSNPLIPNNTSLDKIIKVLNTDSESFAKAMLESHLVRYIAKLASVASDEKRKAIKENFQKQLEEDASGLLITDGVIDFKELQGNLAVYAKKPELEEYKDEIYAYFGLTKEFVQGKYNPDEYDAVYRSAIQPFINKLVQEMTYKLFTSKELGYGNEIRIEETKLDTASLTSRINVAQTLISCGFYSPNEIRRLLFLPTIEGGDKTIQSLNYVNGDKADKYQGVGDNKDDDMDNSTDSDDSTASKTQEDKGEK